MQSSGHLKDCLSFFKLFTVCFQQLWRRHPRQSIRLTRRSRPGLFSLRKSHRSDSARTPGINITRIFMPNTGQQFWRPGQLIINEKICWFSHEMFFIKNGKLFSFFFSKKSPSVSILRTSGSSRCPGVARIARRQGLVVVCSPRDEKKRLKINYVLSTPLSQGKVI